VKLTIVYKLGISAILLVLVSAGVTGWLFYSKTTKLLVEQASDDIAGISRNAGSRLQGHITDQRNDALFLSVSPPIQGMLRALKSNNNDSKGKSTYQDWEKRLQSIFKSVIKTKTSYLKIRFINKHGQELVSVGREGNEVRGATGDELQNKSHRLYVSKTLKLAVGQVYLSEINLNREHGKISVPHQEVLRSATPVYDEVSGEVAGVLVVTVDVGRELREIQNDIQDTESKIYITNDHGGYLLHSDASKTYGFDLGKRYRIQEDIPKLSKLYLPDNKIKEYTFLPDNNTDKYVIDFIKIPFDEAKPERFIAVTITKLYADILSREKDVLTNVLYSVWVFVVGVVLLAVMFSYRLSHPLKMITQVMDDYTHNRETTATMPINSNDEIGVLARSYKTLIEQVDNAKAELKDMNRNLESKVVERTRDLDASEERQRGIVENMADPLITIDEYGIVSLFNTAAEKTFAYTRDEVIGQNINMLMPEPYYAHHDSYLERYRKTGVKKFIGSTREVVGQRKDGSTFPIELTISEMIANGQKIFTGVARDITERKQIDKMKNEFVSTVSHELRTPLTAIRGSLSLINGGAVGDMPESASEMLKIAGNNTERLLLLINDILDIQKIESGQIVFNFEDIELMPFIDQALEDNKSYGDEFQVQFVLENRVNDAHVYADKLRLMQVMSNLLSNAAKFSPEGEKVVVSVERKNNVFRISFIDNGPGIPEEFHAKIFERFTQSDSSDTRQKGGTGLGLNITRAIVTQHEGNIDFISKQGEGATFYVELPELA